MDSKNIIIVDDDAAILDSLNLMLNFEGFEVKSFEKGKELFECLENDFKPDLILIDMWLSEEDGRDICKLLKSSEVTKNIPIIIMSASRGLEKSALQSGANAFIAKPFEFDNVIEKLNKFIV